MKISVAGNHDCGCMIGIKLSHNTDDATCGKSDDFYLELRFTFYGIWETGLWYGKSKRVSRLREPNSQDSCHCL